MKYEFLPQDKDVWEILLREEERQSGELEMIASENHASAAVLEALGSIFQNKYSEGYPSQRYYGGNKFIDELESLAIERAKRLFGADHVNVQPLSGSPANAAAYMAFLNPGDKVLGLKLDHGGHLSHGHKVNFSGRLYNFVQYELDPESGYINMDSVAEIARRERPKMIVAGFTAYSREVEWKRFKEIADEVGAFTLADIAHTAGLIAAGELASPVPFFDVITTTTHKTLRGPRGAIIMCRENYAKNVDRAVFPGMQGGPHDHVTAAKAVAFYEALQPEFKEYARQVIANAQALSRALSEKGYSLVSGGTDNHLLVVDLRSQGISGREAEQILERVGISVSRSTVPNDPNPPLNPSGIRLGTPAITTRGLKEAEMDALADIIDGAIKNRDKEMEIARIKEEVRQISLKHPLATNQVTI